MKQLKQRIGKARSVISLLCLAFSFFANAATGNQGINLNQLLDSFSGQPATFQLAAVQADECNLTSECKSIYGDSAYDCVNSRSSQSYCLCEDGVCADLQPTTPPEPEYGDECDTTAQCKNTYGNTANDCVNSRSDQSYCQCGTEACRDLDNGGDNGGTGGDNGGNNGGDSGGDNNNPPSANTQYIEQNGLIVIEAENTLSSLGEWQGKSELAGYTGASYLEFNGNSYISGPVNSPLEYSFTAAQTGTYHLHMYVARETIDNRTDVANDGYVRLDGNYDAVSGEGNATKAILSSDTKFYGGADNKFVWASGKRLDKNHAKHNAIYNLKAGEEYSFTLSGRSKFFKVDRIVFRHSSVSPASAQNLDLPETLASNMAKSCEVSETNQQWHRVELSCKGYFANESNASTFINHRFNVTFSQGEQRFVVPGHFAASGDAADTGASSGDVWRAYFMPPNTGDWNYQVSFRKGTNIALSQQNNAGQAIAEIDGQQGQFSVSASTADSQDLRSQGLLQHLDGERYQRFAGSGKAFIEAGMGSPENIFGYAYFDNTVKGSGGSCKGILHQFAEHESDWQSGDPSWGGAQQKGKGLIGLINYLGSHQVNSAYIMLNTVKGDGCDAHPWVIYQENGNNKRTFDVSKLDQWERAFSHMTKQGLMLHMMTQETENETLLNNASLGLERKLYYRELISRFGHHPAVQWNLGEEQDATSIAALKAYADYIKQLDPYDHGITLHTYPGQHVRYDDMLGHPTFNGPTIQYGGIPENASATASKNSVYGETISWLNKSAAAGKQWYVSYTEASGSDAPKPYQGVKARQRVYWMWASVMSGGAGFSWYLKNDGGHAYDLAVENLREFDQLWQQSGHVHHFFKNILQEQLGLNLQNLVVDNGATTSGNNWVLSDKQNNYIINLRDGGSTNLKLANNNIYQVYWYNPRSGELSKGLSLSGGTTLNIGNPPKESNQDWVALVTNRELNDDGQGNQPSQPPANQVFLDINSFDISKVDGFVPAYKDNTRNALAVNANSYKDQYAAVRYTFNGSSGDYKLTITTLTENDGESSYRLVVNGQQVGDYTNPKSAVNYQTSQHTWSDISLSNGDEIQIEFNSTSNGEVISSNGQADYARGRWRSLEIIEQ
ncbi:DUF5060 domain-containing protein [Agarivorans aestuarii]|uniref:DUF5060 domain-containing protein n=1 Tax=Agarivorans aestuarii TaxID=1563703 RepID=A0ABU7G5R5_9ALTE|nr:DUF5060 domain-containing protein [Agarivorans aestuarii]MEE1674759.1 DUF5060 domain-containing protein [Agarivorans aestuarii]